MDNINVKLMLSAAVAPLASFFAPTSLLILPILWLVLFDILTGMYRVRCVEKLPLTSRGFLKKLPQLIMFFVAIAASIHADPFFIEFGIPSFQASKLVVSFYGIYELFSILENLGKSGMPIAKQISNILQAKLPVSIKDELNKKEKSDDHV